MSKLEGKVAVITGGNSGIGVSLRHNASLWTRTVNCSL